MKRSVSSKFLPVVPVATGIIVLILRLVLYTMENESGLLPHRHPLYLTTLILAVGTAALVGFFAFRLGGSQDYPANFPASKGSAAGSMAAGFCLFPVALEIWQNAALPLDGVWALLGFAAGICLILSGWCQWKGTLPHFAFHFVVGLFFALHMVCRYREWSGNPQVEDYIFALFGCIFLAMFAYYRAAFAAGNGRRRMTLFSGMMALFFCLPMLVSGSDRGFFLAGWLWVATNQCVIDPPIQNQSKGA